jgi:PAS domain-containing protein
VAATKRVSPPLRLVAVDHIDLTATKAAPTSTEADCARLRKAGSVPRLILRLEPLPGAHPVIDLNAARSPNGVAAPSTIEAATAPSNGKPDTSMARWSAAAAAAPDGCLVIDPAGRIVSLSAAAADLLDAGGAGSVGRPLLDVVSLIDFDSGDRAPDYARRIPPLAVLSGHGAVHSLLRVRHADDARVTLDVCSVPLHDTHGAIIGSLSFLAPLS